MVRTLHPAILCSVVIIFVLHPIPSFAATDNYPEVGVPASGSMEDSGNFRDLLLDDLGTELELSLGYNILTGQGIKNTYGGLSQAGVGISFLVTHHIRTFLRLDYSFASTDPYQDVPGFDAPEETTVKSIPMTFGLKFNMSQNQRLRLFMGIGMQVAWQQEESFDISFDGNVNTRDASGFNFGFVGTFGPELVLGKNKNLLGLEFGLGGTKGDVSDGAYSHHIDMTGFTTRVYYAFNL